MKSVRVRTWWNRPCGGRDVLRLALPLVISTVSWTVMNFTDRMFLLWHSTSAMAAALPAAMLGFAVLCFPLGVVSYANTFVAQYYGAGRCNRIGAAVWQAVWICLIFAPLLCVTIPLAPLLFSLVKHEPQIARLEVVYYQVLMLGGGGVLLSAALSSFFTGRGQTRVVMLVDTAAAVLNGVLDYVWIFGRLGFPAMGIRGAAWATTVSQWTQVLLYCGMMVMMARQRGGDSFGLATGWRLDRALMRRLWRYGTANGLQMFVDVLAFTVFILLVGRLGQTALAATNLAFNINSLAFIPMLGVGLAVSTLVGQQLGQKRPDLAVRATWTAFWIAEAYMGTIALLYVLAPDWFLWGYACGARPDEFAPVRELTIMLLRFVAAYTLFDAMSVIFVGAIKGAGDTRFILLATLMTSALPALVTWCGISYGHGGVTWCWIMITAWACGAGIVYFARFLHGGWRKLQVIEPEPGAPAVAVLEGGMAVPVRRDRRENTPAFCDTLSG